MVNLTKFSPKSWDFKLKFQERNIQKWPNFDLARLYGWKNTVGEDILIFLLSRQDQSRSQDVENIENVTTKSL